MKGRVYVYVPTNKKYNYPKVEGLLYNTQEKRFSFLSEVDVNGKAIGETAGKAIRDFQTMNPGVGIIKVETKPISTTTTTTQTPPKANVTTNQTNAKEKSGSSVLLVIAAIAAGFFF
ncbi:hypothetical protein [Leptospira terpstrae]|uniref:Uncharacterized protein n=1 Tax=Leptospira terpstrae serovar Hualin str. LT 11-33 = ATCC 700639 TaxID=1257025 RepID=N1VQM8_9LEPT|nr:hypothetical protein [Leptospira terpstrae]EMY62024.1 hypothetical protein LEP1GSC203_3876 [Leptospira terpstrae serovar Hualin str. LT 11-33 = ATCC 700639]